MGVKWNEPRVPGPTCPLSRLRQQASSEHVLWARRCGHHEQDRGPREPDALREGKPRRIMGSGNVEKASLRRCSLTEMRVK